MAKVTIELDTAVESMTDVLAALHIDTYEVRRASDREIDALLEAADVTEAGVDDADGEMTPEEVETYESSPEAKAVETPPVKPTSPLTPTGLLEASKLTAMDGDRRRGEAKPGGRRRTNTQIADDDRWFAYLETIKAKAAEALAAADKSLVAASEDVGQASGLPAEPQGDGDQGQAISSGDERIDGEAGADAKDEATESAALAQGPSVRDLQVAVGLYNKKFGIAAASAEIPKLLGKLILEHKPEEIPAAVAKVMAALETGPANGAKFTPVDMKPLPDVKGHGVEMTGNTITVDGSVSIGGLFGDEPAPATLATIDDVKTAMLDYARKYDGVAEPAKMKFTPEDMPKLMTKTFGAGVVNPKTIPPSAENYARAVASVRDAIEKNPFSRTAP